MTKMSAPSFSPAVTAPACSRLCLIVEVSEKFSLHPKVTYATLFPAIFMRDCFLHLRGTKIEKSL